MGRLWGTIKRRRKVLGGMKRFIFSNHFNRFPPPFLPTCLTLYLLHVISQTLRPSIEYLTSLPSPPSLFVSTLYVFFGPSPPGFQNVISIVFLFLPAEGQRHER